MTHTESAHAHAPFRGVYSEKANLHNDIQLCSIYQLLASFLHILEVSQIVVQRLRMMRFRWHGRTT
jgi:hypothetical protein